MITQPAPTVHASAAGPRSETLDVAAAGRRTGDGDASDVVLDGLWRRLGDVQALAGMSLTVPAGTLVALLGPSGCGKTTALRVLAGLEDLDAGAVRVAGRDVSHVPAHRRDNAMVFQAFSLMPHMTAGENVAFALELRGVPRRARAAIVDEHLELVGLGSHRDRYAHQLSGGQQQRVALARALAVRPSVLLLDEPLSALDAKVRVSLRDEIRRIQSQTGITTLFVTHDQEEALVVADQVAVMRAGAVVQVDTPQGLYQRPRDEFVATFIGATNRVRALASDRTALVEGWGPVPLLPGSAQGEVTLLVRPEHVRVGAADSRGARVADVSFLGAHAQVRVAIPGRLDIVAQLRVDDAASLRPGDAVGLTFDTVPALAVERSPADGVDVR